MTASASGRESGSKGSSWLRIACAVSIVATTMAMLITLGTQYLTYAVLAYPVIVLMLQLVGWGRRSGEPDPDRITGLRSALAISVGFAALWAGMLLNTVRFDDLSPAQQLEWCSRWGLGDPNELDERWTACTSFSGFPFAGVQGYNDWHIVNPGPVGRSKFGEPTIAEYEGLHALWANYLILTVLSWLILSWIAVGFLWRWRYVGFLIGLGGSFCNSWWLVTYE